MNLKQFFQWLTSQPSYKSRLKCSDAEYLAHGNSYSSMSAMAWLHQLRLSGHRSLVGNGNLGSQLNLMRDSQRTSNRREPALRGWCPYLQTPKAHRSR